MSEVYRYHRVVEGGNIADIARVARVILGIEDAVEELFIELDVDYSKYRVEYLDRDLDRVSVYVNAGRECYKEKLVEGSLIRVVCRQTTPNIDEVYSYIAIELAKTSINLLRSFLGKSNEYMVVLLDRGIAVVLEGSPKKITIPQIPGTLFVCHTHPNVPVPVFSREDVKALLDILSNRGFGECVLSTTACFTVFRLGPFLLEDYFSLLNAIKEYGYLDEVLAKSLQLKSVSGFLIPV